MKTVYVFKTSVRSHTDINKLKPYLGELLGQAHWNFDLEDCDNILRVESEEENKSEIISVLRSFHFDCEELPD